MVVTFESVVEIIKSVYSNKNLLGAIHINPHVFETAYFFTPIGLLSMHAVHLKPVNSLTEPHLFETALQNGLTPYALRMISIKFLLVISLLYKTEWSWELRTLSHKMNLLDILSTSLHYFGGKWMVATNANSNFDLRVWRVKASSTRILVNK